MLFCAFVCSAWAGPTDLPEYSTVENPIYYTISNTRSTSGKYLYYESNGNTLKDKNAVGSSSFFFFVEAKDGGCYIHNYATNQKLLSNNAWSDEGAVFTLAVSPYAGNDYGPGLSFGFSETFLNEENHSNGFTTWNADDAGSVFVVEKVTDFSSIINIPAAKATAIAELDMYANSGTFYPVATSAKAAVNAVTPASSSLADLDAAVAAIQKVVADYKAAAYQSLSGKYFTIYTPGRPNSGYMKANGTGVTGTAEVTSPENVWQFVYDDGAVNVFNPITGLYLGTPGGNSSNVTLTSEKVKYQLAISDAPATPDAVLKLTCDGKSVHMAGGGSLVRWDNGGASEWMLIEMTDFSSLVSAYKASALATLESWEALPLVFDAALLASAETKINAISGTAWSTFALIDNEIKAVADAVAKKNYSFQTTATDNGRNGVYVGVPTGDTKARGIASFGSNALWNFHVQGTNLYLYNALSGKYLGTPASQATLSDAPSASYTFEIIDAEQNIVELKSAGGTLHASNWADDALISWDGDEDASRWIVTFHDPAAELQELLDANASNHAVVPALGQYTTAAYNALKEARQTASTVAEIDAAKAAFEKAKNLPVFMITGVKDYVVGKSIYDDNDAAPNFKTTNVYDKTMWWALDMTETTVGVTEEVGIYNVGTGNGFWGVSSIKITETSDAVEGEDDGIFLFYTIGNNTPIHYQDANQVIVRWNSTEANSGSAHKFTYVGNTFELNKLTDEQIAAVTNLKTVATAKAHYVNAEIGAALGQYSAGDKDAIVAAIAAAKAIEAKTVSEVVAMSVEDINAVTTAITESAATFVMNMPTAGFYRVKSMNGNDEAKKGKYWQSKEDATGMELAAEKDAARSIVYLGEDNTITSYGCGYALNQYDGMDAAGTAGKAWTITENAQVAGAYALHRNSDSYCLSDWTGGVTYGQNDANAAWALEEVDELPVTISAAGYATLYAPVALALPEGLIAYEVTAQGEESVSLTPVNDIIPAYNGVVLQGEANTTYNLTIPEYVPVAGSENLLEGSVAATFVESPAYVLGYVGEEGSKEVGFYTATKNFNDAYEKVEEGGVKWLNNGFKAYLPKTGVATTLRFNFGGTTAIESVLNNGIDANAAIYDLSGRRVEKATKGIYIVNGKKMIVK